MDIKELVGRSIRILHISRKPTSDEFSRVGKVTSIGVIIIGILGLIISTILGLF